MKYSIDKLEKMRKECKVSKTQLSKVIGRSPQYYHSHSSDTDRLGLRTSEAQKIYDYLKKCKDGLITPPQGKNASRKRVPDFNHETLEKIKELNKMIEEKGLSKSFISEYVLHRSHAYYNVYTNPHSSGCCLSDDEIETVRNYILNRKLYWEWQEAVDAIKDPVLKASVRMLKIERFEGKKVFASTTSDFHFSKCQDEIEKINFAASYAVGSPVDVIIRKDEEEQNAYNKVVKQKAEVSEVVREEKPKARAKIGDVILTRFIPDMYDEQYKVFGGKFDRLKSEWRYDINLDDLIYDGDIVANLTTGEWYK